MNLRVNLILDEERRSSSVVRPRTFLRLVAMGVVVLLGAGIYRGVVHARTVRLHLDINRDLWKKTEALQKTFEGLRQELEKEKAALQEVRSFQRSRVPWSRDLAALQAEVPANIQLTQLRMTQAISTPTNEPPARLYTMQVSGRAGREVGAAGVQALLMAFSRPPFAGEIESASLPPGAFRQDSFRDAQPGDRVFDIMVPYKPRSLE